MDNIELMSRDLRKAAKTLSDVEARYLVDAYYIMQDQRIRADNQLRAMADEPHDILLWFGNQSEVLERQVRNALDVYSFNHPVGEWLRSVKGIGPVIAAGLLAHIDITKAPSVGHIWRYAGLDPTSQWKKGEKRPWNASLKLVCWKAGESFVKVSSRDGAVYGHIYKHRKDLETAANERLAYAPQAEEILKTKRIGKTTDAYKAYATGKLPPAHIHARAKRYAVKQFLADLHGQMYRIVLGSEPPLPYPVAHLGHVHIRAIGESD